MSFVRLDNGEFPPLDKVSQVQQINNSNFSNDQTYENHENNSKKDKYTSVARNQCRQESFKNNQILDSTDFIRCRVGCRLSDYQEDLEEILKVNRIGHRGDFILASIQPIRSSFYETNFEVIPDLAVSSDNWHARIAIDLGLPPMDNFDVISVRHFDNLFRHALYLSAPVIVIDCPDSDLGHVSLASIINDRLSELRSMPLVLFKVQIVGRTYKVHPNSWSYDANLTYDSTNEKGSIDEQYLQMDAVQAKNDSSVDWSGESGYGNSSGIQDLEKYTGCPWKQWNSLRSHLDPDSRIGVCLVINDDLTSNDEELSRWTGEPVRMIIIHTDQFVRSPGHHGSLRLNVRCEEFVKKLARSNSLKTSFVIESNPNHEVKEYLCYLDLMANNIKEQNLDYLRSWNDKIQPPLQPLSSNLDSSTYGVFEMDSMKYIKYKEAMIEALRYLLSREKSICKVFILMVLGAGRGPLVDAFINAIMAVTSKAFKFKIYALDKNSSSVKSLRYKQKYRWIDKSGVYETEVVEADMRFWEPNVKADIIATELLGSLSDNELSPECIDGVWKFSTPKTISIPQKYSSYIAPICSFKLHQELYKLKSVERYPYDQIYVVKLTNHYHISVPQQLFKFEHTNLSLPSSERCNERYTKLSFWSKVDTVCHGFAGYFSANLFSTISISTLYDQKTPNMDSWFPAFIPLENPVQMPRGTKLEVHLWRKESSSNVWYQWVITHPIRSRLYSQNGLSSAMSKCI